MNRMTISVLQLCAKRRLLSLSKYVLAAVIIILLIHTILSSFPTNTLSYQCTNCTVTKPMKLIDTHQKSFSNITIAITICGNASLIQGLNALKSALLLSKYHLHLIAMADSFIFDILKRQVNILFCIELSLIWNILINNSFMNFMNQFQPISLMNYIQLYIRVRIWV